MKQLDSTVSERIAVDRDGHFVAFDSKMRLDAGGFNNYSQFIAALAGYCGVSGYRVDKAAVDAVAMPTAAVISGSMRGFGGPQASFAVESLVDEVAVALGRDPIELRERNVLRQGNRTITGAPLTQPMRLEAICQRARQHPLWRNRMREQERHHAEGRLYGVGFALANQAYGTGSDGVMAEVSVGLDGTLTVRTNCVDMGSSRSAPRRSTVWTSRPSSSRSRTGCPRAISTVMLNGTRFMPTASASCRRVVRILPRRNARYCTTPAMLTSSGPYLRRSNPEPMRRGAPRHRAKGGRSCQSSRICAGSTKHACCTRCTVAGTSSSNHSS